MSTLQELLHISSRKMQLQRIGFLGKQDNVAALRSAALLLVCSVAEMDTKAIDAFPGDVIVFEMTNSEDCIEQIKDRLSTTSPSKKIYGIRFTTMYNRESISGQLHQLASTRIQCVFFPEDVPLALLEEVPEKVEIVITVHYKSNSDFLEKLSSFSLYKKQIVAVHACFDDDFHPASLSFLNGLSYKAFTIAAGVPVISDVHQSSFTVSEASVFKNLGIEGFLFTCEQYISPSEFSTKYVSALEIAATKVKEQAGRMVHAASNMPISL